MWFPLGNSCSCRKFPIYLFSCFERNLRCSNLYEIGVIYFQYGEQWAGREESWWCTLPHPQYTPSSAVTCEDLCLQSLLYGQCDDCLLPVCWGGGEMSRLWAGFPLQSTQKGIWSLQAFYCLTSSFESQNNHWSSFIMSLLLSPLHAGNQVHRPSSLCRPFTLENSPNAGRIVVATR